jgi:hypothetical protein
MVLYRKEWEWVHSRLVRVKVPTIEIQTLYFRVGAALVKTTEDPFYLAITEDQIRWIEQRCKLVTWHVRPENRKEVSGG